jgi:hypothetical protein
MEQSMKNVLILLSSFFVIVSCNNEGKLAENGNEDLVTEITVNPEKNISEIIRSPVNADEPIDTVNVAKMTFEETRFDFGTINEGDVVNHVYKFTNTGKVPLIINDARSTCGCTVPKWPKNPINPGESGEISVKFDSKGKKDRQAKPITITANTYPNQTILQIKGNVIPK